MQDSRVTVSFWGRVACLVVWKSENSRPYSRIAVHIKLGSHFSTANYTLRWQSAKLGGRGKQEEDLGSFCEERKERKGKIDPLQLCHTCVSPDLRMWEEEIQVMGLPGFGIKC
ncbi:hypothetical protein SKAU_G00141340 [Synaphobranchus kaupii]|uniref:Uncharacterized protein n=1 Tax=Synaphobranchus kaupii TaxID=118154 RepID=A0A9Q1FTC3_SYNKA|nr:hypothetical protein SKAU_G00141340 [Synaphobranchus kaupii]